MVDQPEPNSFRAAVRSGKAGARPDTPLVAKKRPAGTGRAKGLGKVAVPRSEARRGDHRTGARHRLSDEQVTVRHHDREHPLTLVNLSGGGAMVEGAVDLALWDRVELVLGEHGVVECIVRWMRGKRFGLEFAHETRLDCDSKTRDGMLREVIQRSFPEFEGLEREEESLAASAEQAVPQKRNEGRHPLIWNAVVHHQYEWERVRLRNISANGAMIECSTAFPAGATVYLDLAEAGRVGATVCWAIGDQAGLRFDEHFDLRRLAKSRPAVAPQDWTAPTYLRNSSADSSPWGPRWSRLTVEDLARSLAG